MTDTATAPPRRRRKDARPSEIIDAGHQEFIEKGFAGAKLDDVARRAGIAKGTIYRYFASKDALFEAVVKSRAQSKLGEIEALVDEHEGSAVTLLQMVITKAYEQMVMSDYAKIMRIIIAEGERFPEIKDIYYRSSIGTGMRMMSKIVERGIDSGEFRKCPATEIPRLIVAPVIAAAIWQLTFREYEEINIDRHLAAHMDLILNGLKA